MVRCVKMSQLLSTTFLWLLQLFVIPTPPSWTCCNIQKHFCPVLSTIGLSKQFFLCRALDPLPKLGFCLGASVGHLYGETSIMVCIPCDKILYAHHFVVCLGPSLANGLVRQCDDGCSRFKGLPRCRVSTKIQRIQYNVSILVHSHQILVAHSRNENHSFQVHAGILFETLFYFRVNA